MSVSEKNIASDTPEKFKAEEAKLRVLRAPRGRRMFPSLDIQTPGLDSCANCPTIRGKIVGGDGDPNGLGSGLPLLSYMFDELVPGPPSPVLGIQHPESRARNTAREIGGKNLAEEVYSVIEGLRHDLYTRMYNDLGTIPSPYSTWVPDHLNGPVGVHCRPEGRKGDNLVQIWAETNGAQVVFNQFTRDLGDPKKYYEATLGEAFVPVAQKAVCPARLAGEVTWFEQAMAYDKRLALSLKTEEQ